MLTYQKVSDFIKENDMIAPDDTVIAGVSGGGDSMAMLHMLKLFRESCGFRLNVLHINHGIRGEEADRDQALVEAVCRDWDIPFFSETFSVPDIAREKKIGEEEAGRLVRIAAFRELGERLCGPSGLRKTALAHQMEDVAETLLHNLARGTGLFGMASMRPVSGNIIRPLLCLSREEIEEYLKKHGIPYVTDSTNLTEAYTRNRIRLKILPLLCREVNQKAVSHMAAAARMTQEAVDFLKRRGEALLLDCPAMEKGLLLPAAFFLADKAEQTTAVLLAVERLCGGRKDFTARHVEAVLELRNRQTGSRISLPGSLSARKVYGGVLLCREEEEENRTGISSPGDFADAGTDYRQIPLGVPGEASFLGFLIRTRVFPYEGQKIPQKKYTKWMDYDKIGSELVVRTRKEGDVVLIGKENHQKKLTRVMIDDHIPGAERDHTILVAQENRILMLAGGRMSDYYRITPCTKRVLEITIEKQI